MRTYVWCVVLLAVGAGAGLCSVAVHRELAAGLPWGLVLGLATAVACILAGGEVTGGAGSIAVATGWIGCVLLSAQQTSHGDLVVINDWLGETLLWAGVVLASASAVVGSLRSTRHRRGAPSTLEQ